MSVPLSERNPSEFQVHTHLKDLRSAVTELIFRDFGFSERKNAKSIEHFRKMLEKNKNSKNINIIIQNMIIKNESIQDWFLERERNIVLDIMRDIAREFDLANSIYPSNTCAKEREYIERRLHLDNAIGYCTDLYREIEYIMDVLPVDANKFTRFADMINTQMKMFKGLRKSDNRFMKKPKNKEENKK